MKLYTNQPNKAPDTMSSSASSLKVVPQAEPSEASVTSLPQPKKTPSKAPKRAKLQPAAVLAYLQANPQFFEKHKDELAQTVKSGKKGRLSGNILSLHAAKSERLTRETETLKVRHKQLISTARGNAEIADTIFSVILKLVACRTLSSLRKYLQTGMTEDLQLEAVRLFKAGPEETATTLTAEQIQSLCNGPLTLTPMNAAQHRQLFGPKTNTLKSVCLMALAEDDGTLHGLLALGSTDETRFHAGQATTLANFLRRATTTVLANAE